VIASFSPAYSIVGTSFLDVLQMFEQDGRTEAVVMLGELGGGLEEQAAGVVARMTKPVVAFIGGRRRRRESEMGHAGAIVAGSVGSAGSKMEARRRAGAASRKSLRSRNSHRDPPASLTKTLRDRDDDEDQPRDQRRERDSHRRPQQQLLEERLLVDVVSVCDQERAVGGKRADVHDGR
jgi:hypothetical protein